MKMRKIVQQQVRDTRGKLKFSLDSKEWEQRLALMHNDKKSIKQMLGCINSFVHEENAVLKQEYALVTEADVQKKLSELERVRTSKPVLAVDNAIPVPNGTQQQKPRRFLSMTVGSPWSSGGQTISLPYVPNISQETVKDYKGNDVPKYIPKIT